MEVLLEDLHDMEESIRSNDLESLMEIGMEEDIVDDGVPLVAVLEDEIRCRAVNTYTV